jgi:hypothetical protein
MNEHELDALENAAAGDEPFAEVYELRKTIEVIHEGRVFRMEVLRRILADKGERFSHHLFEWKDWQWIRIENAPLESLTDEDLVMRRGFNFLRLQTQRGE